MSDHHDADRRAPERAEADHLREPEPPACFACEEPTRDGATLCEKCAPPDNPRRGPSVELDLADDLDALDGSEGE